ncbi:MAG: SDR family oxidoreductase, partial [Desulfobacterales bacterium]|nr:SDR family oxidoreductase [Desulfobacterales bacterium]
MTESLKGKCALVTGAGKKTGIGYAVARKLAQLGADVAIADLGGSSTTDIPTGTSQEMESIAAELADRFQVRSIPIPLDVTRTSSVETMKERLTDFSNGLDILVNNAGASFGVPNGVHTYGEEDWIKTVDVNLHGVFRVSKALVPLMQENGGAIINTASRAGEVPPLFNGAYAVAKAGVIMLTKV